MTTYFVAGHATFADGTKWYFHRVINWTHKDTAHDFHDSIMQELESKNINAYGERGQVVLTAFNKL